MNLFAKKSLGQHFLNSSHVLSQIIEASNVKSGDLVLEIGPGTGVLTKALLEKGAKVVAVEKDRRAIDILGEIAEKNPNLKIIEGDILELDIQKALLDHKNAGDTYEAYPRYSIIANIPYYITGAILEKFLECSPRPEKMVLLVQREVAERIVARDGKESILSMSVKAFGEPKIIARVPRGAFTPPPSVESAILAIENISDARFLSKNGASDAQKIKIPTFFKILKAGFAHKRKFLKKNLEILENIGLNKEKINEIWQKNNLNEKVRSEDLKLEEWLNIAKK